MTKQISERNEKGQFVKGCNSHRNGKLAEEIYGIDVAKKMKLKMSAAKKGKKWEEIWGKEGSEKRRKESYKSGSNHVNWKGGIIIRCGYRYIYSPDHINSHPNGYVAEHRLIAESALGRFLKTNESVHHINGDRLDNRNTNLLICSIQYHNTINARMAKLYQKEHFQKKEESNGK